MSKTMTLVFKRSKCFVLPSTNDHGEKKFLAQAAPANPVPVPFWVAETETFKRGITDLSIVNLTPPHLMPGYKPEPVIEEEPIDEAPKAKDGDDDEDDDAVQTEKPQAPFGGQPMTPVQPAVNVGKVTSGSRKTKQ